MVFFVRGMFPYLQLEPAAWMLGMFFALVVCPLVNIYLLSRPV